MLFLNPTYLTALLFGFRILELFNGLWFYKKKLLESIISNQGLAFPWINITMKPQVLDKVTLLNHPVGQIGMESVQ